ncbi:hypothetical protein PW5551_02675 [Petrotoga sp. 9PW.55.5.1]|uniref:beta-N-acetylhexosaminidase n=1 Tax=Petrotoga sp. 9PW.55.5.1 TaxID=1308979 RepID=UPI000DC39765|nr:beta-N-acetylhexosaminidase [Petrotoga sp. 9PW.55.5.1]RAO99681.1 hypothetical protein PW5551_02675 [Petrotoga sp. 9PW.55.5.1]
MGKEDLEKVLGKLFLIGISGTSLNEENRMVLNSIKPGVIILFSRNIKDKFQIKKFIDDIKNFLDYEPLFCIDQEGGMVTRLNKGFSIAPSAMAISATSNVKNAYIVSNILAKEMRSVGIDFNLAPVVDINSNPKNSVIGIRSFSDDESIVINYASEYVRGLHDGGVLSCLKHFPGIGSVDIDPHLDLPQSDLEKKYFLSKELLPFLKIDSPVWMPTHVYLSNMQKKKEPVSLSKEILTDFARNELNFQGVLVADDFEMGGVANFYSVEQAVIKSLTSGMDIVSICHSFEKQLKSKKAVLELYKKDAKFRKIINTSLERINNLFKLSNKLKEKSKENLCLDKVGNIESISLMQEIIDKSITIFNSSGEKDFLPVKNINNIFYFIRENNSYNIEDVQKNIDFLSPEFNIQSNIINMNKKIHEEIKKEILEKSKEKNNLVFSENAYLSKEMVDLISNMSFNSKLLILIALRNPYDVFIPNIKHGICTYGFNKNVLLSLSKILKGKIKPTGSLPIKPTEV